MRVVLAQGSCRFQQRSQCIVREDGLLFYFQNRDAHLSQFVEWKDQADQKDSLLASSTFVGSNLLSRPGRNLPTIETGLPLSCRDGLNGQASLLLRPLRGFSVRDASYVYNVKYFWEKIKGVCSNHAVKRKNSHKKYLKRFPSSNKLIYINTERWQLGSPEIGYLGTANKMTKMNR